MTDVKDVLPDLMSRFFLRLRAELAGASMDGLRFSHLRVMSAVPPEGANVTTLAEAVGMTKQGCGQFVTRLSASGHLRTAPDPGDRRVRLVLRTAAGERVMADVQAAVAAVETRLASEVGPRRYATFRAVLEEVVDGP